MDRYLPFQADYQTPITVEHVSGSGSVQPHKHTFYEFVLVTRGSCIHRYRNRDVLLLPGDVFLLPAREEHSYSVHGDVEIFNCQFFPDRLGARWHDQPAGENRDGGASDTTPLTKRWDTILDSISIGSRTDDSRVHKADINGQGIVHLTAVERKRIEGLLQEIIREQAERKIGFEYAKHAYLEIILVQISRVQARQFSRHADSTAEHLSRKRRVVGRALTYIEEHLAETIDITKLAGECYVSPNYFRSVFKEMTGLTPVNYLNRLRIITSLEILQNGDISIGEAAERVGILDPNYFSRLYRKIMGHSPREEKRRKTELTG